MNTSAHIWNVCMCKCVTLHRLISSKECVRFFTFIIYLFVLYCKCSCINIIRHRVDINSQWYVYLVFCLKGCASSHVDKVLMTKLAYMCIVQFAEGWIDVYKKIPRFMIACRCCMLMPMPMPMPNAGLLCSFSFLQNIMLEFFRLFDFTLVK